MKVEGNCPGCGEEIIDRYFVQVELDKDSKNGGYMGVAQKNEYFRAKNEPWRPPRRPPCYVFNTKTLPLWYPVMTVTKSWMSSRKT